eukprot:TRINITY_DN47090_c0_g1_i1.p2 TRINITY_DN47090_c0_g1~~TRINITY_DN47090_c0_g1_i1.p2  ORF type:complete len:108 (+),score=23.38 TRINITY_DN47090_c0_g1_i1:708-1031(+)
MVTFSCPDKSIDVKPVFFFKQKTAYEMLRSLVGSEMCIRDSCVLDLHGLHSVVSLPTQFLEGCTRLHTINNPPIQGRCVDGGGGDVPEGWGMSDGGNAQWKLSLIHI